MAPFFITIFEPKICADLSALLTLLDLRNSDKYAALYPSPAPEESTIFFCVLLIILYVLELNIT